MSRTPPARPYPRTISSPDCADPPVRPGPGKTHRPHGATERVTHPEACPCEFGSGSPRPGPGRRRRRVPALTARHRARPQATPLPAAGRFLPSGDAGGTVRSEDRADPGVPGPGGRLPPLRRRLRQDGSPAAWPDAVGRRIGGPGAERRPLPRHAGLDRDRRRDRRGRHGRRTRPLVAGRVTVAKRSPPLFGSVTWAITSAQAKRNWRIGSGPGSARNSPISWSCVFPARPAPLPRSMQPRRPERLFLPSSTSRETPTRNLKPYAGAGSLASCRRSPL